MPRRAAGRMNLGAWQSRHFSFACAPSSGYPGNRLKTAKAPLTEFGVDAPGDMGQYPVLARMVYRGDVREGKTISTRPVAPEDLMSGKLGFQDQVRQRGDVKEFSGTVPPAALAAGRVAVDFVKRPTPTAAPGLARFVDAERKIVRSETGQLLWDFSDRGFFTIDTPGTQGVVGFASGREHALSDVSIQVQTPFALMFEVQGDLQPRRFVFYECLASRPNVDANSVKGTIEPTTDTLSFVATPRQLDGMVKAVLVKNATNETAYTGFYTSVYEFAAPTP
jgi:hypothetical protein